MNNYKPLLTLLTFGTKMILFYQEYIGIKIFVPKSTLDPILLGIWPGN